MATASTALLPGESYEYRKGPWQSTRREELQTRGRYDRGASDVRRMPSTSGDLPERSPIVVYCAHGQQVPKIALSEWRIGRLP
jgi:rhodanese-related sulfurtransferase